MEAREERGEATGKTLMNEHFGAMGTEITVVHKSITYVQKYLAINFSFRDAPDTFNFLRHVMRAIWSVRPKCSHRYVSLKETPLKPVQILKHTTFYSAEQTAMRTKWFKHIAILTVQEHLLLLPGCNYNYMKMVERNHICVWFCSLSTKASITITQLTPWRMIFAARLHLQYHKLFPC